MDADDLHAVADDLKYLQDSWREGIGDGEIRRGSAVLRRLLVEDAYGTAWRAIGFEKESRLIAVDLLQLLGPRHIHDVAIGLAGGAHLRGMQVAGLLVMKGNYPPVNGSMQIAPDSFPGAHEYSLSEFLKSPSGAVDGHTFSRKEVIKYIANVKGGVHLGGKQRKAEAKLVARLGKIDKQIMVQMSDGLLVEIVAIAQALAKSEHAKQFIAKALSAI
jgi:hypothetical protein